MLLRAVVACTLFHRVLLFTATLSVLPSRIPAAFCFSWSCFVILVD